MDLVYSIGSFVFMILIFYFLLIRPQQRMQKQRQEMLNN